MKHLIVATAFAVVAQTSFTAEASAAGLKSPLGITCRELVQVNATAAGANGMVNTDLLQGTQVVSYAMGYMQGHIPSDTKGTMMDYSRDADYFVLFNITTKILMQKCGEQPNARVIDVTNELLKHFPAQANAAAR